MASNLVDHNEENNQFYYIPFFFEGESTFAVGFVSGKGSTNSLE